MISVTEEFFERFFERVEYPSTFFRKVRLRRKSQSGRRFERPCECRKNLVKHKEKWVFACSRKEALERPRTVKGAAIEPKREPRETQGRLWSVPGASKERSESEKRASGGPKEGSRSEKQTERGSQDTKQRIWKAIRVKMRMSQKPCKT